MGALSPPPGSPVDASAVGARVVVRHRGADDRPTDALGELVAYDGNGLTVRRRDGSLVRIAHDVMTVAKVVPPRRTTLREIRALETAAVAAFPGLEQHRIGGWVLRAGAGFTGRANSVVPLDDPGMGLLAATDAVEAWYEERGLVPRALLPDRLGDALAGVLGARGWPAYNETLVLVADLDSGAAVAEAAGLPPVVVEPAPDDAWLAAYHYRGGDLPAEAAQVLRAGEGLGFCRLAEGGATLAIGRAAVTAAPDGTRWLGLTAVEVAPTQRRRGLGRHLVAGLLRWGRKLGATATYLQVAADNDPARRMYDRLGFTEHHRYRYRQRPAP